MKELIAEFDLLLKKVFSGPFWSILIAVLILICVLIYALVDKYAPGIKKQIETSDTPSSYRVVEVVDGDTVKILYNHNEETVRLIGINAPERDACLYEESTEKLKELVDNKYVSIEFDPTQGERDKYGRLLLFLWQDSTFVNDEMIRSGYVYEYTYDFPYKYQTQFIEAQKEARENKRGLWGDTCSKE